MAATQADHQRAMLRRLTAPARSLARMQRDDAVNDPRPRDSFKIDPAGGFETRHIAQRRARRTADEQETVIAMLDKMTTAALAATGVSSHDLPNMARRGDVSAVRVAVATAAREMHVQYRLIADFFGAKIGTAFHWGRLAPGLADNDTFKKALAAARDAAQGEETSDA